LGIDEPANQNFAGTSSMPRRPIPVSHIVDHVCQALAVDAAEFSGKGRHKRVVFARSVAAVLARQLTTQSFPEIARAMGRGNHSTIITAQRRLQRDLDKNPHQIVESDLAPLHPGLTLNELLTTVATTIRQSAR
jgi:chromosomal replication initiator protein